MCALTRLLFKLNTLQKKRQTLSRPNPWYNDIGVLNLHHDNDVKVQISQSENRNSYSVCKLNNKINYKIITSGDNIENTKHHQIMASVWILTLASEASSVLIIPPALYGVIALMVELI